MKTGLKVGASLILQNGSILKGVWFIKRERTPSLTIGITKQVSNKEREYERSKSTIRDNPQLAPHYDLDAIKAEPDGLQADLSKAVGTRKEIKQAILTYEEYLELFTSIGVNLAKTYDISLMDETIRKFFLNFTIKDNGQGTKQRYEITHELKSPWAEFIGTQNFDSGRLVRTLNEPTN